MKKEIIKTLGINDFYTFEKIFREFEKAPFFEKWTEKEILEEFRDYLKTGKMFAFENKGLMNIQFNKKKLETLPYKLMGNNIIYLSDIVVIENYRGQGIGNDLFKYLTNYGYENNFDSIYFRTNLSGSMSEGLGIKNGYEIITDCNNKIITEEVSFLRQNGKIENDTRKYLIKKLK